MSQEYTRVIVLKHLSKCSVNYYQIKLLTSVDFSILYNLYLYGFKATNSKKFLKLNPLEECVLSSLKHNPRQEKVSYKDN